MKKSLTLLIVLCLTACSFNKLYLHPIKMLSDKETATVVASKENTLATTRFKSY